MRPSRRSRLHHAGSSFALLAFAALCAFHELPAQTPDTASRRGWVKRNAVRSTFVADSTECRATNRRMGDDTDAALATCLRSRFAWAPARLYSVAPGCDPVKVTVVSTAADAAEAARLGGFADSIARALRDRWRVTEHDHERSERVTWTIDESGGATSPRVVGPATSWSAGHLPPEQLALRYGSLPPAVRLGRRDWKPFQLLARFDATCLASADVEETALPRADQPYFEYQVERQVTLAPDSPQPEYPAMLKSAGIEGEVLVEFVVDTAGRAEPGTFKVLKSSHDGFTQAVRNALPSMRFTPALLGGRKVPQLVQRPFIFSR